MGFKIRNLTIKGSRSVKQAETKTPRSLLFDLDKIAAGLNRNPHFLEKNECVNFALYLWYHFHAKPVLHLYNETRIVKPIIGEASRRLDIILTLGDLSQNINHVKFISRKDLIGLPSMTLIIQLTKDRTMMGHAAIKTDQYIWEKDFSGPIRKFLLEEWHTHEERFPHLVAIDFELAAQLFAENAVVFEI